MKIRVLLFGAQRDVLGESQAIVEVGSAATAAQVLRELARQQPSIAHLVCGARLAVNGEFASDGLTVGEGDECALIGMVSGG